ncbi:MAG: phospholipid carrier-dependent glycosyltransferase [Actinobacteria bacterium]|nr:phospholipid carrier-dependent glycosyltransferase [Actinomycetota bacterium]
MDAATEDRRERSRWTHLDTIAITVVTIASAVVRAIGLGSPPHEVFDEPFYARDACWYVRASTEICETSAEANLEHPPLGKWLLAVGDAIVGHTPVGWRIAPLIAGVLTVALTYLFARRLLRSTGAATFAAALLAIDFLHFVHSRIAMLDVFLGLFVIAAFTSLALDRDDMLAGRTGLRARPWRTVAGLCVGAAIATKSSGVLALAGVVAVALAWEIATRQPLKRRRAILQVIKTDGVALLVSFVIVPALVYVAAHIGRVHGELTTMPWADGSWIDAFVDRQRHMLRFHLDYASPNPYSSPPWWWLLLKRPVTYHFEITSGGLYRQLLGTGSPIVWWLSIPAIVLLTAAWFRRNSPTRPEGLILAGFYWNYLPWMAFAAAPFLFGSGRSAMFAFYVVPMLPFMCTAIARVAQLLVRKLAGRVAVGAFTVAAVVSFVFYYPFLTAEPLPREEWRRRIWIFNSCERDRAPIVVTSVTTENGTTNTTTSEIGRAYMPPEGWCWIQMKQEQTVIDWDEILGRSS